MNYSKSLLDYEQIRGIHESTYFLGENVEIKGYIYIGEYSIIERDSQICNTLIGRFVHVGQSVKIGTSYIHENLALTHPVAYENITSRYFKSEEATKLVKQKYFYENNPLVSIGSDTRICDNVYIMGGVSIGRGCIIYPNSVVLNDIPEYSIVAGNPAVVVKKRFDETRINLLKKNKIEEKEFSTSIWQDPLYNFADILAIPNYANRDRTIHRKRILSGKESAFESNLLVIGPSHIKRWVQLIQSGKLNRPVFELWGISGLSIFSQSIKNICKFWTGLNSKNRVLIFVPDPRIGNSIFYEGAINPLFISKKLMKLNNADKQLKYREFRILDELCHMYNGKIRLLFWCMYGRQKINIAKGMHVNPDTGEYEHIFKYEEMRTRYSENILNIPEVDNYFEMIEPDASVHPTIKGYKFLTEIIQREFSV